MRRRAEPVHCGVCTCWHSMHYAIFLFKKKERNRWLGHMSTESCVAVPSSTRALRTGATAAKTGAVERGWDEGRVRVGGCYSFTGRNRRACWRWNVKLRPEIFRAAPKFGFWGLFPGRCWRCRKENMHCVCCRKIAFEGGRLCTVRPRFCGQGVLRKDSIPNCNLAGVPIYCVLAASSRRRERDAASGTWPWNIPLLRLPTPVIHILPTLRSKIDRSTSQKGI
jgi:hypothetical protein